MTRRAATIVVTLVAAALVGVALLAIPASPIHQTPTLGLDLQGGLEVTLQAVPPKDRKLTKADLDRSVTIMRDRVDRLGVAEPEIRTQGDDQITIQLPGVKDPAAAARIIGKTAQLELFDLEANLVSPSIDSRTREPIATAKLYDLLAGQQALVAAKGADTWYVFDAKTKKLVRGPVQSKEGALAKWGGKLPAGEQAVRRADRHGRRLLRDRRGRLPGRRRREPDHELVLPPQVRPAQRPRDDGQGPQPRRDAAGLRHANRRADRADGVHEGRREAVRRDHGA